MTNRVRGRARLVAVAAGAVLAVAGAVAMLRARDPASPPPMPTTLTWWYDGANEPTAAFWSQIAAEFERTHPHVTIELTRQPESMESPLKAGVEDLPDLFGVEGGHELVQLVRAGRVMDVTDLVGPQRELIGAAAAPWSVDGRQYGLPFSMGIEGLWYRKSLFARVGIATPPATMVELADAAARLKAAGVVPVVVDAGNRWPAAQIRYAALGLEPPVLSPGIDTPPEQTAALERAGYAQVWLDAAYGLTVGGAMNAAAADLVLGRGSPQGVVDAMTAAARQA